MASSFINDKAAEVIAAADAGDTQRIVQVMAEAIKENTASAEQTVAAVTQAVNQQKRR
ncbi:hypothetical protein [Streptomyces sp. WAC 04229]|uniref:hypothetical protein n=1 Tax=Streptomyces sp. WAC 04229 TaxID=2203206 RepID=UPI00163C259D|nr:hypothetical protein [Streptomyces sp. WAC 04229]